MNYNKLKCLRFSHGFYFSKLVFLNYILPLNISFGVIRLIFKECHIHGGVELFCDGRWTLIYLMIWRVPRKIHSIVLGSSLLWCCWGMWTKAKQSNTFMEEMSWVLGYDLRKTLHDVWKLKTWEDILLMRSIIISTISPQKFFGTWEKNIRALVTSNKSLLFLSAISFCWRVSMQ